MVPQARMTIEANLPCDHHPDYYKVTQTVEGNMFHRDQYLKLKCRLCHAESHLYPAVVEVVVKRK